MKFPPLMAKDGAKDLSLKDMDQSRKGAASWPNYAQHLTQLDGKVSRYNADLTGEDCHLFALWGITENLWQPMKTAFQRPGEWHSDSSAFTCFCQDQSPLPKLLSHRLFSNIAKMFFVFTCGQLCDTLRQSIWRQSFHFSASTCRNWLVDMGFNLDILGWSYKWALVEQTPQQLNMLRHCSASLYEQNTGCAGMSILCGTLRGSSARMHSLWT